jgi:hypothetical protein
MVRAQPPQDPGPVQEIVDQRIDSDKRRADFEPVRNGRCDFHTSILGDLFARRSITNERAAS